MERFREGIGRRSIMAASIGLSRIRHRTTSLRDAPDKDGETVRTRDRGSKRERVGDALNRKKRSRGERAGDALNRKKRSRGERPSGDDAEQTTEDSMVDEDDIDTDDASELSNHNHQLHPKSLHRPRGTGHVPPFKVIDETIAVSVPRKARSASVKRSHDNWVSGNGGFGDDHGNYKLPSSSPASRSGEAASPSSSNISKPSGSRARLPKASTSSSAAQEDIEIEIAEVLYGLMKHFPSSKKEDDENASHKDVNGVRNDFRSSPTSNSGQTPTLAQPCLASESDHFLVIAAKKTQKTEADPFSFQNSSILSAVTEDGSFQPAKTEVVPPNAETSNVLYKMGAFKASSASPAVLQEVTKLAIEECGPRSKEESECPKKESATCNNSDQDSTVTKAASTEPEADKESLEKFTIGLMAPLPTALSSEHNEFVKRSMKKEAAAVEFELEDLKPIIEKSQSKLDLETNHDIGNDSDIKLTEKQQSTAAILEAEATAQSSPVVVPLPIALAGWPNGLSPLGYMPPFHGVMPMDGTTESATLQHRHYLPSQPEPRPKRCTTHQYIACNIRLHQQFTKTNNFWPPAASSTALSGTKSDNVNTPPSAENMIAGNSLKGSFAFATSKTAKDRGQTSAEDKSSEVANLIDMAQKKQLVANEPPQPAAFGNLLNGPAFIFSLSQHQAPVAAIGNQGHSKPADSTNSASFSGNAMVGLLPNPSVSPAFAMIFNYPNLTTSGTPYMTTLPNNGRPYPISPPVPNSLAPRAGNPSQSLPLYNVPFYQSQMLHPSQLQQQLHSQPLVQPVHQNASTSNGSSLSNKQQQAQQTKGTQVNVNNFVTSTNLQSQQLQSHQSQKLETEMSMEGNAKHLQNNVQGQNFMVPFHTNCALMPSTIVGGKSTHGEKQQQHQSKEKISKTGVKMEHVPSQAYAMSFTSINRNSTAANFTFSSMAQSPALLQSFPDMTHQGYQVASVPQAMQKNNSLPSERRVKGSSTFPNDGKKATVGKPPISTEQTYVFDHSAKTLNFASSPFIGNWPPHSIIPALSVPVAATSPNTLQQQQNQATAVSRSKELTTSSPSSPSVGVSSSTTAPAFSQSLTQSNISSQNLQWSSASRVSAAQALVSPLVACNNNNFRSDSQQQGGSLQGHGQISFVGTLNSALASQGQQMPSNNQSPPILIAGRLQSGDKLKTSVSNKANLRVPAIQAHQGDKISTANAQKSSPVCGRNVPSILSTCPSHISELKY